MKLIYFLYFLFILSVINFEILVTETQIPINEILSFSSNEEIIEIENRIADDKNTALEIVF